MNKSIKEALTKLSLKTGIGDWITLLPSALFRARNTPLPSLCKLTPFEVLYGAPPPVQMLSEPYDVFSPPSTPLAARLAAIAALQGQV